MIFFEPLDTPEGPVSLPDGSWYCVEMGPDRGSVTHISADGKRAFALAHTGRPNGLAVDHNGMIWVAESSRPALLRMQPDGIFETWVSECNGQSFIFPNDLAFGPDGLLYMTDSGIDTYQLSPGGKIRSDYLDLTYDGRVYQIDIQTREIRKLDEGILFTNGIVFDKDGNLYVNETITGNIYRYENLMASSVERQLFGNVNDPSGPPGWRGPDGMKFGQDGNLYCTVYGQGDVTVLDQSGQVVQRIKTVGRFPTNLAFGPNGERKIYVTEVEYNRMEVHQVSSAGQMLFDGTR
jgi:gluconolactonase